MSDAAPIAGQFIAVPLRHDFEFCHEPAGGNMQSEGFAGRGEEITQLADRLLHSNGGAFLVTGYRGVGKTSFVNCVISRLHAELRKVSTPELKSELVDVQVSVSRRIDPLGLMHHV